MLPPNSPIRSYWPQDSAWLSSDSLATINGELLAMHLLSIAAVLRGKMFDFDCLHCLCSEAAVLTGPAARLCLDYTVSSHHIWCRCSHSHTICALRLAQTEAAPMRHKAIHQVQAGSHQRKCSSCSLPTTSLKEASYSNDWRQGWDHQVAASARLACFHMCHKLFAVHAMHCRCSEWSWTHRTVQVSSLVCKTWHSTTSACTT